MHILFVGVDHVFYFPQNLNVRHLSFCLLNFLIRYKVPFNIFYLIHFSYKKTPNPYTHNLEPQEGQTHLELWIKDDNQKITDKK